MTEAEWLASADPAVMLEAVHDRASDRKLRLFAVACCRRVWHLLTDERSRRAVEGAEAVADGTGDNGTLYRHEDDAYAAFVRFRRTDKVNAGRAAWYAAYFRQRPECTRPALTAARRSQELCLQVLGDAPAFAADLRCVVGTPFRPVAFAPEWRTSTVVALARGMYETRDFAPMPVLADALEDAGCANATVLDHCRGSGPHVRGCWVVDLVLGKA